MLVKAVQMAYKNGVYSLTESELVSTVVTLFVAGHETTTHLLGNGFVALLKDSKGLEFAKSMPEISIVDEMARFDGSVPRSWRINKKEVEIGGKKIPSGSLILPILASANHDPLIFPNPEVFDITRDTKKHLAFGKGVHVCLGAPLARIEGQGIIKALFKFKPNLHIETETLKRSVFDSDNSGLEWKEGSSKTNNGDNGSIEIMKVVKLIPVMPKPLEEARGYVVADYQEKLEKDWIQSLREKYPVHVNQDVLNSVIKK